MDKIKRVSKLFRIFFQVSFIMLPILLIMFWVNAPTPLSVLPGIFVNFIPEGIEILSPLTLHTKLLGFMISLLPMSIKLLVLYFLIQLFKRYECGKTFSLENITYIKRIAYTLLVGQVINIIYQALITPALTWHNPHGHRFITITFSQTNASIILFAMLTLLIAWIMHEACQLKEEQLYTV